MKHTKISRIFAAALITFFSVAFTPAAHAAESTSDVPVTVKYVGAANNAPIFQFSFGNETVEQFEITVSDKYSTLYSETIKGKGLVRKYQFVNNDSIVAPADDEIVVTIKNIATKNVITYTLHPGAPTENERELIAVN